MRLALVHGLGHTAEMWSAVRSHLAPGPEVVAAEVPHGSSFALTAEVLAESLGHGLYVGYSMGGRLCLRIAVEHPELVAGLVLISCSAGIAGTEERLARVAADEQLAQRVESEGVEAFMAFWVSLPMFAGLSAEAADAGSRAARYSPERLAHQLRGLGQGAQESLWGRLGELSCPTLVVTGSRDQRYQEIGDAMAAAIPDCERLVLDGGHSLALERPAEVASAIEHLVGRVGDHRPGTP